MPSSSLTPRPEKAFREYDPRAEAWRMMSKQHIARRWWSVDLPGDWTAKQDDDCLTAEPPEQTCALQFSAYRKDAGEVLDCDLREFAREHLDAGAAPVNVSLGSFTGIRIAFLADGMDHRHWWVSHHSLMLFVTFTAAVSKRDRHEVTVQRILESLEPAGTM